MVENIPELKTVNAQRGSANLNQEKYKNIKKTHTKHYRTI